MPVVAGMVIAVVEWIFVEERAVDGGHCKCPVAAGRVH